MRRLLVALGILVGAGLLSASGSLYTTYSTGNGLAPAVVQLCPNTDGTQTAIACSSGGGGGGGTVTQGAGSSGNPWWIQGLGTAGTPAGGVLSVATVNPPSITSTAYSLTTSGTSQQLPSVTGVNGFVLQNQSSSDVICVGTTSAVAYVATGPHCQNGFQLAAGQSQGFAVTNTNLLYWVGPTSGTSSGGDYLGVMGN